MATQGSFRNKRASVINGFLHAVGGGSLPSAI